MHLIPHTRQEWLRLLVFPFRAFVLVAPAGLFIWLSATEGHRIRGARGEAALPVALGLMICVGVLLVAALVEFIARRRDAALVNVGFATAAFLVSVAWVLPMCAN